MGKIRTLFERLMLRTLGRDEYESEFLRRYFKKTYNIEIGLYTIGAFDRWRIPPGTRIGRYCSIAKSVRLLDANHPLEALSTHPYFYLAGLGVVPEDRLTLVPPVIEDDVWLGHNAVIAPGCTRIGRGAAVGANAVVMSDVPPYAIMTGSPARLVRFRFPQETIDAIEATRWWELDKADLAKALGAAPELAARPSPEAAIAFLKAQGRPTESVRRAEAARPEVDVAASKDVLDLLEAEIPAFKRSELDAGFEDLKVDSFGMINLRIVLEQALERQINDRDWASVRSPRDIVVLAQSKPAAKTRAKAEAAFVEVEALARPVMPSTGGGRIDGASERRAYRINMPQMALGGLSESWLFKEIGDIHWSVLTRGLGADSSDICDSEGNRLYATFTRIRLRAGAPLVEVNENSDFALDLALRRYGAGMFFSEAKISGPKAVGSAELMTSFSRFGEAGANTSLLKGQPVLPDACPIPPLKELPPFAAEYRERRALELATPIFETEYDILPPHDINGVGLLYFAAYPIITDLCAARYPGEPAFSDLSTVERDVCYFANSTPDETLVFRIHEWAEKDREVRFTSTLSRKSDGKVMAMVQTTKRRVGRKVQPLKVARASELL